MKKRLVAITIALLILLSSTVAFAAPTKQQLQEARNIANLANIQIELIVVAAQLTPWDDTELAVCLTEKISSETIKLLTEKYEVNAVCEYKPYKIDGKIVYIDPIKIIEF